MDIDRLEQELERAFAAEPALIVVSKPASAASQYRRVRIERIGRGYQAEYFTETQVFHRNLGGGELTALCAKLVRGGFRQLNLRCLDGSEADFLVSKKGALTVNRRSGARPPEPRESHNREKNYILREGEAPPPLVDMGVMTPEGRVIKPMYDKFWQINRFLEIMEDECRSLSGSVRIIDFGCGKSYLTFVVYYYFTVLRGQRAEIVGLDLKCDVIDKCSLAAKRYGYDGLRFEVGDVRDFKKPFDVDIVMTLHACDTATDWALYSAVNWDARMIFSVPRCQHELNGQVKSDALSILTRYGIVKERFSALLTDALRANILEYCGYRTQLLEFIDFEHTPKNILIRAVRRPSLPGPKRERIMREIENAVSEFSVDPTLYRLLIKPN